MGELENRSSTGQFALEIKSSLPSWFTPFVGWDKHLILLVDSYLQPRKGLKQTHHHWYFKHGLSKDYQRAFVCCCKNGELLGVKYLVSSGANITADDNLAVRYASKNGHLDTVKYLVSLGANITADDNYAVRCASKNGHLDTVKYLVSLGANITPLAWLS